MGELVVRGQIQALDTREIRNEKTIIIIEITDYTDTIVVDCLMPPLHRTFHDILYIRYPVHVAHLRVAMKLYPFLKTTGFSSIKDKIIEIGAVRVEMAPLEGALYNVLCLRNPVHIAHLGMTVQFNPLFICIVHTRRGKIRSPFNAMWSLT